MVDSNLIPLSAYRLGLRMGLTRDEVSKEQGWEPKTTTRCG